MGQPRGVYPTSTYIRTVLLMAYTTIVILVSALSNNFISFFTIINDDYSTLANYVYSIHSPICLFPPFWLRVLPPSNPRHFSHTFLQG